MTTAHQIKPAPVRKTVLVAAPPQRAFEVFVARMGAWWPKSHSVNSAPIADVVVEPRTGGRWFERGEDGSEKPWGDVLAWEPPARLVLAWRLDATWTFDPTLETEVEVTFTVEGAGTRVSLEHRHLERMGAGAGTTRDSLDAPNGWGGILERYAEVVWAS